MKTVLILAALWLGAQQSASDRPYELKGETPGTTTLKQFKANHEHAECLSPTARQTRCRVYEGVSFGGVIATPSFKGCVLIECSAQGIFANFIDGRLVYLSYGVSPFDNGEILLALKAKFGEPSERNQTSFTWKNSIGYLSLMSVSVRDSNGSVKWIATAVTSALNDAGEKTDI